ncbi:MAG: DUF4242 domain-containing protein [Fulvivirga sp.]|nr:DUF4242 domain-containing protein [Fulvivirga sp.]
MPIYMDRHFVPGITAKDAASAHREDVNIQEKLGCRAITYWVDEERDSAFCLIDAPDIETVKKMHDEAHGLVPHEIIPVNSNVVEAFLGRISDPEVCISEDNLKIFNDPAFRIILVTKAKDPLLLVEELGKEKATELLQLKNNIIREQIQKYEGREVDLDGIGFVVSFISIVQAVDCARAIQKALHIAAELIDLRIGLHAGLPVNKHKQLFGKTINYARYLCDTAQGNQIIVSALVNKLYKKNTVVDTSEKITYLNETEEDVLQAILETLEGHWRDPQFGVEKFSRALSLSKSNLYRKCMNITGMSPNALIREFRLQKALTLINSKGRNISQTTFDCGFNSPSYFTKCFHDRFGIKPHDYMKLAV